jgi:hypothetical protein
MNPPVYQPQRPASSYALPSVEQRTFQPAADAPTVLTVRMDNNLIFDALPLFLGEHMSFPKTKFEKTTLPLGSLSVLKNPARFAFPEAEQERERP